MKAKRSEAFELGPSTREGEYCFDVLVSQPPASDIHAPSPLHQITQDIWMPPSKTGTRNNSGQTNPTIQFMYLVPVVHPSTTSPGGAQPPFSGLDTHPIFSFPRFLSNQVDRFSNNKVSFQ